MIRGRRLAVEHVLDMLAAGDEPSTILAGYPWLEIEDIQACLEFQQWMDRECDRYQEWERDVEVGELEQAGRDDETETGGEWTGSVEPDYDSEEEKLTVAASAGRRVIGYV